MNVFVLSYKIYQEGTVINALYRVLKSPKT